ncbi:MAG: hypothetical protein FJ130_14010 [Deltaproteobacteria bacterium]|nr:hypothetical protein [Deltaproteobacteria bacterium]
MAGVQKSLRLPPETMKKIEQMAKETGQDFSNVTKDLLQEAIKMRRCPGILFSEGTGGRRAGVAGTGIEVWEMIAACKSMKGISKDCKRHIIGYPESSSRPPLDIIRSIPRRLTGSSSRMSNGMTILVEGGIYKQTLFRKREGDDL